MKITAKFTTLIVASLMVSGCVTNRQATGYIRPASDGNGGVIEAHIQHKPVTESSSTTVEYIPYTDPPGPQAVWDKYIRDTEANTYRQSTFTSVGLYRGDVVPVPPESANTAELIPTAEAHADSVASDQATIIDPSVAE